MSRPVTRRTIAVTRRRLADAAARWVVSAGGLATIASILAMLGFIAAEVVPLFRSPRAARVSTFSLPDRRADLLAAATDEYRDLLAGVTTDGAVRFLKLADGRQVGDVPIAGTEGERVVAAVRSGKNDILVATAAGRLVGLHITPPTRRGEAHATGVPQIEQSGVWPLVPERAAPALLAGRAAQDGVTAVYALANGAPQVFVATESRTLFGEAKRVEARHELPLARGGTATQAVVDARGRRAYVGASNGFVQYWDLSEAESPRQVDVADVTGSRDVPVTALAFLLGDQSLVVGDAKGRVSVWFPVRDSTAASGWRLQRVHVFEPHSAPVSAIAASPRDKGFLTADESGQIRLRYSTTDQTLLTLPDSPPSVAALVFAPKANGAIAVAGDGTVVNWDLDNPHPEVSLRTLFGKVWYEGYDHPEYVWQSTGATDDFEPKLSLVPLIFGTIKGTLYALLFAVPVAVLAAVYTSQFSHARIRGVVKPTVEIMAALPSVVLGFLAGLWLAPVIENVVPAVLAMLVVIPAMTLAFGALWHQLPAGMRRWLRPGTEALVLIPLIIAGVQLCLWANPVLERTLFGGDFRVWLSQALGARFDQRNALVVGFAMGFAVIPIIFTISEDALSNVPQRLVSASLALGATPWQTAMRVVMPTASPGIFSAIMIGFGRAVGETMIVLMATGNTPVLDWSVFTGMRTLSANIAVEVPEAPHGATLYRVLFLTALLLFVATFIVNTVAELVRLRLRQRYQRL